MDSNFEQLNNNYLEKIEEMKTLEDRYIEVEAAFDVTQSKINYYKEELIILKEKFKELKKRELHYESKSSVSTF